MVRFHDCMPRSTPNRYVEITAQPEPNRTGWYSVTLSTHDEAKTDIEIEVSGEAMTLDGAKSRATELARHRKIEDVIWRHQSCCRTAAA